MERRLPYVALVLWMLLADAWFEGPLLGRLSSPFVPAVLLLLFVALAARLGARAAFDRRQAAMTLGLLALATLVRLPALLNPAGVITGDSAVNGIVADELRAHRITPPVYPPGYPYEGTLKVNLT